MSELITIQQLLNSYKLVFAFKKKISPPEDWYPKTAKEIEDLLESFLKSYPDAKKLKIELKDYLDKTFSTVRENDLTLVAKERNHKEWLTEDKKVWKNADSTTSQFSWYKSKTAFKLGNAFNDLDNSTDDVLSLLEDPKRKDKWMTRGMVVGDVQSGKTSHYTGLITKAIDSGYKLIIVMSGIYNALRAQTQERIENNTIKTSDQKIQASELNKIFFATSKPDYDWKNGVRIVLAENDFSAASAKQISMTHLDPTIMIVKKNVSVLANILIWLEKQDGIERTEKEWNWNENKWKRDSTRSMLPKFKLSCDQPLLIIDDECDSASIDIAPRKLKGTQDEWNEEQLENFKKIDPSKTNQLIRRILECFKRNAYVGYTATPLANTFINYSSHKDDEGLDIFPKDFIRLLKRYDEHIGPEDVFGIAEKNYDPDEEVVSLSEDIDKDERPQVKWIYDYRDDFDDPIFLNSDGTINEKERDDKYREEAKDKEVKGWLPLYHDIAHPCLYKEDDMMPPSLKEAINIFLINIATKFLRQQKKQHNSMLVHVSRFTRVQQNIINQIKIYLDGMKKKIAYGQDEKDKESIRLEFNNLWINEIKKNFDLKKYPNSEDLLFSDIWDKILETITSETNPIEVVQINSQSDDVLDYERHPDGWNVIVVGGAAISRGITLEELSVSYFTRVAKIPTSDTLIQMGRWFGYRKGYEDLWRVYVPKILHIYFRLFSFSMEKAREKFAELSEQEGRSPTDFAMEVPCFPGINLISKSKSKDMNIVQEPYSSFTASNRTSVLYFENEERINNIELTRKFIESLSDKYETEKEINKRLKDEKIINPISFNDEKIDNNLPIPDIRKKIFEKGHKQVLLKKAYLWRDTDSKNIVKFFANFKSPPNQMWSCKMIAAQIKALSEYKNIDKWNVGIFSIKNETNYPMFNFTNKISLPLQQRSLSKPYSGYFSIRQLTDPSAEFMDICSDEYNNGIERWLNLYKKRGKCIITKRKLNFLPANYIEKIREQRKKGLLIIYPWSTKFIKDFVEEKDIYMGWQLITPPSRKADDGEKEDKLIYNIAMNQAAREHRETEYRDFFNPDFFD